MEYTLKTLKNGIRVLHKPAPGSGIMHLCLVINTGSRDERLDQSGLAHFIEHLLFKGTARRSTYQILNRLESVGADLNAYTTKERIVLHASFLNAHLERAMDLLTDIAFHSTYPEAEIEKEKGVISDELDAYKDMPEELIADEFDNILFKDHIMGMNILGTLDSIQAFNREHVIGFIRKHFTTHEIAIGLYGNVDEKQLNRLCDKHLGGLPETHREIDRAAINSYSVQEEIRGMNCVQSHCIIGNRAFSKSDPRKRGLQVLNNLLGGAGMSSRLNLEIREKIGACYTIESCYSAMSDTGAFSIYFGTDPEKRERCLKLIHKELTKLRDTKLSPTQLKQAQLRFNGQVALSEEGRMSVIIGMTKSMMDQGSADSLEEIFNQVNTITADDLRSIANEVFDPKTLSMLAFTPND